MKTFFRNIHLYLSLAAGLVIMIACLTGAILVFEKELEELSHPARYRVSESGTRLELDKLVDNARKALPGAKLAGIKVYAEEDRTVEIGLILADKGGKAKKAETHESGNRTGRQEKGKPKAGPAGGRPTHTAFANPYTGEVIEVYSSKGSFFQKTMALHRWLLGSNGGIGKYIVGVSTFLFMFILITGVILWWPKTRNILIQRLKIKWDGNWKRLNHDLHLVFGFYSAIFLFIFAFTAMSWSFEWFNKGIYTITKTTAESPEPPPSVYVEGAKPISLETAFRAATSRAGDFKYANLRTPKDSLGIYAVTVLPAEALEMETDVYYVDQFDGSIRGSLTFDDKNLGQRVRAHVKPIHISSIYGTPSKVIGFIVCLLGVTFPITGVIMWLNRLKAERKVSRRN